MGYLLQKIASTPVWFYTSAALNSFLQFVIHTALKNSISFVAFQVLSIPSVNRKADTDFKRKILWLEWLLMVKRIELEFYVWALSLAIFMALVQCLCVAAENCRSAGVVCLCVVREHLQLEVVLATLSSQSPTTCFQSWVASWGYNRIWMSRPAIVFVLIYVLDKHCAWQ